MPSSKQNFPIFNHSAPLVSSWLLQYKVAASGPAMVSILNSFSGEGIVIETDTSALTPALTSLGSYVVRNGHAGRQATQRNRSTQPSPAPAAPPGGPTWQTTTAGGRRRAGDNS